MSRSLQSRIWSTHMRTPLLQPWGLQPSSSEHMRTAVLLNNPNYITCYTSITYHRIYISSLLHIYTLQPQLLIRSPDNCRAQLQITQFVDLHILMHYQVSYCCHHLPPEMLRYTFLLVSCYHFYNMSLHILITLSSLSLFQFMHWTFNLRY